MGTCKCIGFLCCWLLKLTKLGTASRKQQIWEVDLENEVWEVCWNLQQCGDKDWLLEPYSHATMRVMKAAAMEGQNWGTLLEIVLILFYSFFTCTSYSHLMTTHCQRTITQVCSLIAHAVCILFLCHILNDELPQGYYLARVPHVCIGTVGQWKQRFLSSVYELFNLLDYKNNFVLHWWSNNQGKRIGLGAAAASEAGEKLNLQGVCFCRICSNVNMSNCTNFCKKFLFRPEGLDTRPVCDHDCEYEGLSKESLIGGGKREQLKKRKNKETVMLWKERTQAGAADFVVAQQTWQEEGNGSRIIRPVLQE